MATIFLAQHNSSIEKHLVCIQNIYTNNQIKVAPGNKYLEPVQLAEIRSVKQQESMNISEHIKKYLTNR